jgi:hypothetical protein
MKRLRTGLLLLLLALGAGGCGAAIGDSCSTDSQCPAGSYCDRTMPDGYCTRMNCRFGDCPEGSVCVEFPNQESYCMDRCQDDGDCRDKYSCIESIGLCPFCSVDD